MRLKFNTIRLKFNTIRGKFNKLKTKTRAKKTVKCHKTVDGYGLKHRVCFRFELSLDITGITAVDPQVQP